MKWNGSRDSEAGGHAPQRVWVYHRFWFSDTFVPSTIPVPRFGHRYGGTGIVEGFKLSVVTTPQTQ
eukprot:6212456-Pleurochrysis_carterae.AAC.4